MTSLIVTNESQAVAVTNEIAAILTTNYKSELNMFSYRIQQTVSAAVACKDQEMVDAITKVTTLITARKES